MKKKKKNKFRKQKIALQHYGGHGWLLKKHILVHTLRFVLQVNISNNLEVLRIFIQKKLKKKIFLNE